MTPEEFREEVHARGHALPAAAREAAVAFFMEQGLWERWAPRESARYCVTLAGAFQRFEPETTKKADETTQAERESTPGWDPAGNSRRARRARLRRALDRQIRAVRQRIFGRADPPFADDEREAARWIGGQLAQEKQQQRVRLSFLQDRRSELRAKAEEALSELSRGTGISYRIETHLRPLRACGVPPIGNVSESLEMLTPLADVSANVAEILHLPQEAVVRWILCGSVPELPYYSVRRIPCVIDRLETSRVVAVLDSYPTASVWREVTKRVRELCLEMEGSEAMEDPDRALIDDGRSDQLDEAVSELTERMGATPTPTRSASLKGSRVMPDDRRLERLVERLGGVPAKQKGAFWVLAAEEWEKEQNPRVKPSALRKRWSRLRKRW